MYVQRHSQLVFDDENHGWWHKYDPGEWWWNAHTHSRSWSMVDKFCRYHGVVLARVNHTNFTAHIYAGNIIALDYSNDGDWDHMGYVTEADNYVGSYGYYDYKVAQHTSNYHEWASNDANSWETYGDDGARYGRVWY